MASVLKRRDTDMTEGSIPRLLIYFALPLMIGNVFQQLYNTVDSIVVGNYVSKQALAAVGCTGPVINALFGLFGGLAAGAGVVISQFYGAHDKEKLHKTVQTTIAMSLVMCVVLTALGVWLTPMMLELMSTPEDVMADATEYLRIYFWGISGVIMYYIGAGILRAVGDSTRPLYFLIFSALTNTVLDVVFVKYFSMGIAGAAIATVIAQVLSAVLVLLFVYLYKQLRRVYRIKEELSQTNAKLARLNEELGEKNEQLSDSNAVKVQYIARFFDLCSMYIDKMDDYRKSLKKLAQDRKFDELNRRLKSTSMLEDEQDELYKNFDAIFLNLYPSFVEDFNALLTEDERIVLKQEDLLNKELRIYALLRLGITDSVKIASFLRCSLSTVYNYRTKVRNKAAISREEFEKMVMKIGTAHKTDV